ncbi:radical SAM family heme chaperone HemW [Pedobacter chitinilyticus]|uniref:Heme chaperone HemW n=1 Tax=Pedobacter chitinilyticus TaxID=2233776 RepID=A0A443YPK8_9SPHI|nr:radical SAM family heme chaperone HemW [Pedobacter chitinilyticus]RWU05688.1 radical SAM family heme chaperone HemW [Pedobacter chitinilyticus]
MAGIYIHIPFCKKACTYCDFHFTTSTKYLDEMVEAICMEIVMKKDRLANQQIESIYFGGGTPTTLPSAALQKILATIEQWFSISANAEITIEANPDDLTAQKITELRQLPFNRFSIGTQSFFNEDLIWMNRAHNAQEATDCIKRSQDAGFEKLTIDLIYGYPLLNNEKWTSNIQTAISLEVPHISAYSLTVEPRTALANAIEKGKQPMVSDDQSAEQFLMLVDTLTGNGFDHYEISNYSLPGKYAVHNTNYWKGVPYLGIGPSAHGFDGINRYINIANNAKYLESIGKKQLPETIEQLNNADQFNEYVMTSLRTMWGISLEKVNAQFGKKPQELILKNIKPYLSDEKVYIDNHHIYLSNKGKLFADGIAAALFLDEDELN